MAAFSLCHIILISLVSQCWHLLFYFIQIDIFLILCMISHVFYYWDLGTYVMILLSLFKPLAGFFWHCSGREIRSITLFLPGEYRSPCFPLSLHCHRIGVKTLHIAFTDTWDDCLVTSGWCWKSWLFTRPPLHHPKREDERERCLITARWGWGSRLPHGPYQHNKGSMFVTIQQEWKT